MSQNDWLQKACFLNKNDRYLYVKVSDGVTSNVPFLGCWCEQQICVAWQRRAWRLRRAGSVSTWPAAWRWGPLASPSSVRLVSYHCRHWRSFPNFHSMGISMGFRHTISHLLRNAGCTHEHAISSSHFVSWRPTVVSTQHPSGWHRTLGAYVAHCQHGSTERNNYAPLNPPYRGNKALDDVFILVRWLSTMEGHGKLGSGNTPGYPTSPRARGLLLKMTSSGLRAIEPIVFSKSSGNPIFGQIFGHQRAENEVMNKKMYRGQETHPMRINATYEMNWANSFFKKFQKPHFRPNIWPPEGRKWG